MRNGWVVLLALVLALVMAVSSVASAKPAGSSSGISFSTSVLLRPDGDSEPAVSIAPDGMVFYTALSWTEFFTNTWKAPFGSEPVFQVPIDAQIGPYVGGLDADVDVGSTGTVHFSTLMGTLTAGGGISKLGVSAIACRNGDLTNCKAQIIDASGADRQWITSDGTTVYISYHDSGSSTLIHVQRSDDDGFTWRSVASPIPGRDGNPADATFNSDQGPIVADPTTHSVFAIYAAGEAGLQKGTTADFNNVYVARSTDRGLTWISTLVHHALLFTALNNIFPALAVDPTNGKVYASWSDAHTVWFSTSADHGSSWSAAVAVNSGQAATAVFPWIAAYRGQVDVVYYGTPADSKDDPNAVWDTYLARTTDDGARFTQVKVSDHPNHVGVICTQGTGCQRGTRNLLDLFEVAINPLNGKAVVIFTDDTLTTFIRSDGTVAPLPQVIVSQEK